MVADQTILLLREGIPLKLWSFVVLKRMGCLVSKYLKTKIWMVNCTTGICNTECFLSSERPMGAPWMACIGHKMVHHAIHQIATCVTWIDCLEINKLYPTGPSGVGIGQQGLLTLTHLISVCGVCSSLKCTLQNQGHLKSSEEISQGKSVSLTRPC